MESKEEVKVEQLVDVEDPRWEDYLESLNEYSIDVMGLGEPLSETRIVELRERLPRVSHGRFLIATIGGETAGILTGFLGFSSFQAKPLLNIHDLAVRPAWQGRGVGKALLNAAEALARREGCCRLSLEVRTDNERALRLYEKIGYSSGGSDYKMMFMEKSF